MNNQKGFANIILIGVIVMILGVVGYFTLFKKLSTNEQPTTQQPVQTPVTTKSENKTGDSKDWLNYSNSELGIAFRYPYKLGKINFNSYPGDTGKKFSGSFGSVENYILRLGGMTKDFTEGRVGDTFDVSGFSKEGSNYYLLYGETGNKGRLPSRCIEFVKEVVAANTSGLLLRGLNHPEEAGYYPCPGTKYGAVFNLKSSTYPGIIFWVYDDTKLSQKEFEEILSTLEIKN